MAYLIAAPEMMTAAAADLATIGSNVNAAHAAAAPRTVAVLPAAADEVSAAIASVFANHAQAFQELAGKAAAFNDQFVQTLKSGGAAYAQTEATSAAGLLSLLSPLLSLLPPGIQIDLLTAVALAPFLLIFSPFIGAVVFAALVSTLAFGLMHPQQLLQLLMMLGL
jgi:PE family